MQKLVSCRDPVISKAFTNKISYTVLKNFATLFSKYMKTICISAILRHPSQIKVKHFLIKQLA